MSAILPKADYCSYASPLILKQIQDVILYEKTEHLVVLNSFPENEFITPLKLVNPALQLVWFSQNIDFGRGLEILIPEIDKLYPLLELHLIGNTKSEFYERVLKGKKGIKLHGTLAQLDIHSFLASCDVGLAIDMPVNLNRKLALTNKIIAYTQAGLHILATDTPAHLSFLEKMEDYTLVNSDMSNINNTLKNILSDITNLRNNKLKRYMFGKLYNWENQTNHLIKLW
jgi:glycosyltransferase involved in cell wall biosynthesis